MSREKFEARMSDNGKWPKAIEKDSEGNYKLMHTYSAWVTWQDAWLAGRESMRDEALQECWYDKTPKDIADAIRKIEP